MSKFMIPNGIVGYFCLLKKPMGVCGIFRIFEVRLGYHLIIGPFSLGMPLPLRLYPTLRAL
jgi:hypothetical protein